MEVGGFSFRRIVWRALSQHKGNEGKELVMREICKKQRQTFQMERLLSLGDTSMSQACPGGLYGWNAVCKGIGSEVRNRVRANLSKTLPFRPW